MGNCHVLGIVTALPRKCWHTPLSAIHIPIPCDHDGSPGIRNENMKPSVKVKVFLDYCFFLETLYHHSSFFGFAHLAANTPLSHAHADTCIYPHDNELNVAGGRKYMNEDAQNKKILLTISDVPVTSGPNCCTPMP